MRIPCRCNRRRCQARRNLSKRPELYARWPHCHRLGCDGQMYVDVYRLRRGPNDHPPLCRLDCYHHTHRVDSPRCVQREDYVLTRSPSKHSPFAGVCDW